MLIRMNNTNTIETVGIHGHQVVAKTTRFGTHAKTYANRTQADRAAANLRRDGVDCWVAQFTRPFYVIIKPN